LRRRGRGDRLEPPIPPPDDVGDLARQGYRQELHRTLGSFSSFAAGFSYLSILTGMFQNFHLGYAAGGPAFFWTWPAMFLGQLTVALCFAELAAHYPLCGGVYQWSRHVGSRASGWLTGWVYLGSLVVTLAAVALALQVTLPQVLPWCQFIGSATDPADSARNAVLLGLVLIVFTTVINAVGVRLLARINNVGVFSELIGAILLIVLLAAHAVRGPAVVFDTLGHGTGQPLGYFGPLCAAAVMASYVMYGYDTAGSLAEETREPRRKAPRAILQALTAAAAAGALLLLFSLMAAPDLLDENLGKDSGGLPHLVTQSLGETLGIVFLCDVVFAITVCALAVHTGTVRIVFAMARDNNLPFARSLSRVWGRSRTPIVPVLVTGTLAFLILLVNINQPNVVGAVVAVSIVWANLAYLMVTFPLLLRRLRGWPGKGGSGAKGLFTLGRWGVAVNVAAVLWGAITVVNMAWPRPEVYGEEWYARYAAPLFTAVLLAAGVLYYGVVQRHKEGVLPEHKSVAPPEAGVSTCRASSAAGADKTGDEP
jgi:urea carboxylase system permease